MLQVCPNSQKRGSVSNSSFVNLVTYESFVKSHMELSLFKNTCDNKILKKTVYVFTDYEYEISFYDTNDGKRKTITGLVISVNEAINGNSITIKYIPEKTSNSNNDADISVNRGPGCGCLYNKPDISKYDSPVTIIIPVANITDINYVAGSNPITPNKPKKGVEVVLLGISAEFVRAVVINLKMIDDCADEAVKDVYLKVGGVYNIAYFDSNDKSMYELEGKLLSISETKNNVSNNSIIHQTKRTEQCGLNNSIYNSGCNCEDCNSTDKDDYMNSDGLENEVLLTFDCSSDFSSHYHTLKLSTVRDCTVISETDVPTNGFVNNDTCCDCNTGPIEMSSGNTKIIINPITGEVNYSGGCTTFGSCTLQEIMDFYFGG